MNNIQHGPSQSIFHFHTSGRKADYLNLSKKYMKFSLGLSRDQVPQTFSFTCLCLPVFLEDDMIASIKRIKVNLGSQKGRARLS